jgi:hypothetical protein
MGETYFIVYIRVKVYYVRDSGTRELGEYAKAGSGKLEAGSWKLEAFI